ncbi:MAG: hypothetical protein WBB31_02915 [Saprospiraceae bacterium]
MKTQLLIFVSLIFIIPLSSAQADLQWMISNGTGKMGLVPAGNQNFYPPNTPINLEFTLQGVTLPGSGTAPKVRNDVFVIYKNFEYYNSRYDVLDNHGFFYNNTDATNLVVNHNFKINPGLGIGYFYLTNTYEGDDLPQNVRVPTGNLVTNQVPYTPGSPNTRILSANHDVVINKDITLIINYDSLLHQTDFDTTKSVFLRFNQVEPINGTNRTSGNILNLQPVFVNNAGSLTAGFPSNTYSDADPGVVALNTKVQKYGYINLRPTLWAYQNYGPDQKGNPRFNAVFTIINRAKIFGEIKEPLRASHDPNFLRVDSICMASDRSYVVFYHLEFENVSETGTNTLKVAVRFPEIFNLRCLKVLKWFAGGADCQGNIQTVGRIDTFHFINPLSISRCQDEFADNCKGYIDFRVKVNAGNDLVNTNTSLLLSEPTVYFDNRPFPIERFIDLIEYDKSNEWRRPVKTENCSYCQRPICVPCYAGILAALAVGIAFFMWRRRRSL